MVTQVPAAGLTSVEQSLVEHVDRGEWLDLAAGDDVIDEAAMRSWGKARTCRAAVIRELLRGRLAADPDPHGLRLRGARITGRLDLTNLRTKLNFELRDCLLEEGIVAPDAQLATVGLSGCHLEHPTEPPLDADRLTCNMLILVRATIIGHAEAGAVRLTGAHIGGSLVCDGASLRNDSGPALVADGLQVDLDMQCDRLRADGGVVLGGHIGRLLSFAGAALINRGGVALSSDGLRVDGTMFCRDGFTAQGEVRLPGARIGGRLYFDGAKLSNPGGRALVAARLTVGQDMFCRTRGGSDHVPPCVAEGEVILAGARIGGHLAWDGAQLRNDSGPALYADSLQVDQDMLMRSGFTAAGAGEDGAIRLSGARIGGSLDCTGATFRNDSGPVLMVGGLQVGQNLYLTGGFTATGGGAGVTIDLMGAQVAGTLAFDPARLEHAADPHRRIAVDGLTYTGVPQQIPARDWLDLLRDGTPGYAAQPVTARRPAGSPAAPRAGAGQHDRLSPRR